MVIEAGVGTFFGSGQIEEVMGEGVGGAGEGNGDGVGEVDLVDVSCGDVVFGGFDDCCVLGLWDDGEFGGVDGPGGGVYWFGGGACLALLGDDVGEGGGELGDGGLDGGGEVVGEGDDPVVVGVGVEELLECGEWVWVVVWDEVGLEDGECGCVWAEPCEEGLGGLWWC